MKYALLIHGPYSMQWISEIKKSVLKFKHKFNQIIVVSYAADYDKYNELLKSINFADNVEIVKIKDLINPGFFNINRQIISISKGLEKIEDNSFVFKLRNDQCVDFNKVSKFANEFKVITTNCYKRSDRLYHPSDMFLAAQKSLLCKMYSIPLRTTTHLMDEMECIKMARENNSISFLPIAPESELCKFYLTQNGWDIKNTHEDSFEAIKKYYTVLNSWNIDFRWHKKRTHLCPEDFLILPHYFKVSPFGGFPAENAKCYMQSDFSNSLPTFKDLFFLLLSKYVWAMWEKNINGHKHYKDKYKKITRKYRYMSLEIFPYFMVKKEIKRLKEKTKC